MKAVAAGDRSVGCSGAPERQSPGLVKLTGVIADYKVTRASASFVFTESDRTKMGVIAVAAGIAGLSGQAIAMASNAMSVEEDADYVEFNLGSDAVKGWVWRSPLKEDDEVEVAAEWQKDHYEVAGIRRAIDRVIALYPHCSRSRFPHVRNAIKWWFVGVSAFLAFVMFLMLLTLPVDQFIGLVTYETNIYVSLGVYIFFGAMTFSLARKWMPFVRLAEKVFQTFGLPSPGNVDLVKSSKASRKPDDPGEFGTFYFRY